MLSRILPSNLFRKRGPDRKPQKTKGRARPHLESLESRTVLYATTGNLWPNPGLITISIMPDGTNLGGPVSNLNAVFNSKPALNQPGNTWLSIIERAAQTWAAATNLNFAIVPDDGAPSGSAGNQQGDPGYGDIRIGGYNFGTSTLARTFQPPPQNNYSIAGDIAFNTGQSFNVNTTYDLYTVAVHEIGHALGLDHSSASAQTVMYPTYNGVKQSLTADDTAGIRNIYSANAARDMDRFARAGTPNNSFATASALAGFVNTSALTAAVTGLDLYAASDVEYLSTTVPLLTSGTMSVNVQSKGISLLAPKVTVYAADMKTVLGTATGLGNYGTSVTLSVPKLIAGQQVYLVVQGADSTVFATGSYDLGLSFGANAAPTFATTAKPMAAGAVLSSGGGIADIVNTEEDHYTGQAPTVIGVADDTGASTNDGVTDDNKVVPTGTASAGDTVTVYRNGVLIGTTVADKNNNWALSTGATKLADGPYAFTATATDPSGNVSQTSDPFYSRVDTVAPNAPTIDAISPDNGFSPTDEITNVPNPTFSGTAEPGSTVTLINAGNNGGNFNNTAVGTTIADGQGHWSFTIPGGGLNDGTYLYTATATDVAGNLSTQATSFTVVIDRTAPAQPVVTGISPDTGLVTTDAATDQSRLVFNGTAEAGDWVYVSLDGRALGMTVANSSTGTWSYDNTANPLADGAHSVTVTTMDRSGNLSSVSHAYAVTVDTVATAAPAITTLSPDTGRSAADWVTSNKQNPTLSGATISRGIVQVFRNGALLGQTTAGDGGQWSYTDQSSFTDGPYVYTAKVIDYVGNVSAASAPQTMVVDTTAPVAPAILGFGPDSGVAGDGITSVKAPTLFGTAEPNSTVTIYQSAQSQSMGSVLAGANGSWSFTIPGAGLSDAAYRFTANATDAAGNVSEYSSPPLSLTIDTTAPSAPVVTGISPDTGLLTSDGATNQNQLIFKGTAEANSTVAVYLNGVLAGRTTASITGAWSFNNTAVALPDGLYSVTATATDAAGNTGNAAQSYAVTVDTIATAAPVIATLSPDTGRSATDWVTSNKQNPTLSGTTIQNGIVRVFRNGTFLGQTTAVGGGSWSFTDQSNFNDGSYVYTAKVIDYVGNVSAASAPQTMVVDTTAPVAPAILGFGPDSGVAGDGITSVKAPTLFGTAEPNSTVTIYQSAQSQSMGSVLAGANGSWSFTIPGAGLSDAAYRFTATATDAAGNVSAYSSPPLNLTIDTTAPVAPVVTAISPDTGVVTTDGATNQNHLTFNGTAEAGSTVSVYLTTGPGQQVSTQFLGVTKAAITGAWSYNNTANALPDGVYSVSAAATDAAGNTGQLAKGYAVTVATAAPTAPSVTTIGTFWGTAGSGGLTNATKPTFSGTTIPGGIVNLYLGTTLIGTATASSDHGAWSVTLSQALADGGYSVTATTTDYVGNVSGQSSSFPFTVDSTAPNRPVVLGISPDTGVSNTDGITDVNTPTFSGTAEPGSTVNVSAAAGSNTSLLGTTIAGANGNWALAVTRSINDGTYNVTATATDAAGNTSASSLPFKLTIITKIGDPKVTGISPDTGAHNNDGITNARNIILSGTSDPNDTITVSQNGTAIGTTVASSGGSWSYDNRAVSLADGTYAFTFTASDGAGNVSQHPPTQNVTIDTVAYAPVIVGVVKSVNGSGTPILVISGTAEAQGQVNVLFNGSSVGTTNVDGQGNWQFQYAYSNSATSYSFTGVATDLAGNVSPASSAFNLLLKNAPTVNGLQLDGGSVLSTDASGMQQTINNTPTIKGTTTPGGRVTIVDGNTILGTLVADSKGNWVFVSPVLAKGKHNLAAEASDAFGNYGLLSKVLTFNV